MALAIGSKSSSHPVRNGRISGLALASMAKPMTASTMMRIRMSELALGKSNAITIMLIRNIPKNKIDTVIAPSRGTRDGASSETAYASPETVIQMAAITETINVGYRKMTFG